MERNYSETLQKAKTYFKNMIREREKYMQQLTLDLPKRIEIQTLPLSSSNDVGVYTKFRKPDTSEDNIPARTTKSDKRKCTNHQTPRIKIEDLDITNVNSEPRSSSNTIIESLSLTSTDTPASDSVKISISSSTVQINKRCQEAIEKARGYFKSRVKSENKKTSTKTKKKSKVNESTSTKIDNSNQNPQNQENSVNTDIATETVEKHRKKGKPFSQPTKIACYEVLTPAKKYLRSKLGIDQKSIVVKKDKETFSHSKTQIFRMSTKVKTFPSTKIESKKTVHKETPQVNNQPVDKASEHLSPAKRYLRSKLGIDEKSTNTKKERSKTVPNRLTQNATSNAQIQTVPRPESPAKLSSKLPSSSPIKVRPSIAKNKEIHFKKLSSPNDNFKREKFKSKTSRKKGVLSTKTDIVTNIEPGSRETNKISIELKKPIALTSSMEELLSKALKIGLKKINRSDLQDLQLKIKSSVQSRINKSIISDKSDLTSMQSMLESKISNFQTEMERRQKHTFDKIQELENTIKFRKQQLVDINKTK